MDDEIRFSRDDAERLVKIETDLSNMKESNKKEFKSLHEKLDDTLKLKDKVIRHGVWVKALAWGLGTLITAVAAAAAKGIFFK